MVFVITKMGGQHIPLPDVLRNLKKCIFGIIFVYVPVSYPIDIDLPLIRLDELIVRSSVIFSIPLQNMDQRQTKGEPNSG
jgi:hypothetical protein